MRERSSTGIMIIVRVANRAGLAAIGLVSLRIAITMIGGLAFAQPHQPPAGAAPGRAAAPPPQVEPSAWQKPSGPYEVVMEEDASLPDHTIYRPANLAAFPKQDRLPIVTFSGPGCVPTGTAFRPFYTEVASHGFLIVANGPAEPKPGMGRGAQTKSSDHLASIDWAIAENGRKDSKYYQRIDTSKVASMGQSCGGLQVLEISKDPRFTTLVLWNSGVWNQPMGSSPAAGGRGGAPGNPPGAAAGSPMSVTKEVLKGLRVPIAYFVGKTDSANPNAADDFGRIENVPVFWGSLEIPGDAHGGTFREKNGGKFGVAAVAWLKWRLKGDQNAAKVFKGADCGLCKDPEWEVKKKKID